ncbi:MAG: MBL fold metallo-hydrolase [Candidatus Glassbacteria bacterium RIFCSPLOWO2_12_FULL_58_11]|uniref:MBL fold metallo-hydrolase n=2 Tax=Candidatus Glassiibacteriota TaxID=1817805 RepID=A0A1F5Z0H4_9BACT|nr:MAG: MBL fold metallo-hydrolase [Candidatus Glassbacteria bacterium GWA2_58_10]OGG05970.1 MAG: MBL fold metallo-hydrolase [Candidatus Glassbacteria bacterium RIFCSPLOWO2_12_FULL_58_11]
MIFEQVRTGGDRNFGYFLADRTGGCSAVVDPSGRPELFFELNQSHGCELKYVICTHDHSDHTGGANDIARQSPALIVMHKLNGDRADLPVEDGEQILFGSLKLRIIHTPGHSEDSICVLCEDILLTGDTLFVGKVGGTDLEKGAREEYDSLHKKILTLPDETRVYPGHDYGTAPSSTIGREKQTNPFLLCKTFEEFVDLKANWAEYKRKHGIK